MYSIVKHYLPLVVLHLPRVGLLPLVVPLQVGLLLQVGHHRQVEHPQLEGRLRQGVLLQPVGPLPLVERLLLGVRRLQGVLPLDLLPK